MVRLDECADREAEFDLLAAILPTSWIWSPPRLRNASRFWS